MHLRKYICFSFCFFFSLVILSFFSWYYYSFKIWSKYSSMSLCSFRKKNYHLNFIFSEIFEECDKIVCFFLINWINRCTEFKKISELFETICVVCIALQCKCLNMIQSKRARTTTLKIVYRMKIHNELNSALKNWMVFHGIERHRTRKTRLRGKVYIPYMNIV